MERIVRPTRLGTATREDVEDREHRGRPSFALAQIAPSGRTNETQSPNRPWRPELKRVSIMWTGRDRASSDMSKEAGGSPSGIER